MGNYSVGEKCSGRITNIYQGNWIVELEQNVIGRVLIGASQAPLEIGATISVRVKQNDSEGIILEYIPVPDEIPPPPPASQDTQAGTLYHCPGDWHSGVRPSVPEAPVQKPPCCPPADPAHGGMRR